MSEKEIPYNPPGMDEYLREGARKNSALFLRCAAARATGMEDALNMRGRHENPFGTKPWESAAWLEGYNLVMPPDDDAEQPNEKAEPPPTRDVNRDSGTASANGGWLRRLVRRHGNITSNV